MTVVMGYPPKPHSTVTGTAFSRSRRRRGAGRKPCIKGVQRESLAHSPCLQGVVCYTLQKRAVKTGTVFSAAGVALRAERGEKSPRLHGAFAGCSPAGQERRTSLCFGVSDRGRGYPNIAVTAVKHGRIGLFVASPTINIQHPTTNNKLISVRPITRHILGYTSIRLSFSFIALSFWWIKQ